MLSELNSTRFLACLNFVVSMSVMFITYGANCLRLKSIYCNIWTSSLTVFFNNLYSIAF